MAGPERGSLFGENHIRTAFVASGVGMVALLVLILVLASSQPQGQYAEADSSQYEATVERAAADLEGYRLLENGRATLDIERAMEIVAERGVDLPLRAAATPPDAAAPAPGAQDGDQAGDAPADEGAPEAAGGPPGGVDAALGEQAYANCVGCHQANGQGVPGAFPPLAGWMPQVVAVEGGKEYFAKTLLWGLQGEIAVDGQSYNGVMPGWAQLSDEQIAAVLNHELTSWGNADALPDDFEPYSADDIAAQREEQMSAAEVYELRQTLELP